MFQLIDKCRNTDTKFTASGVFFFFAEINSCFFLYGNLSICVTQDKISWQQENIHNSEFIVPIFCRN